LKAVRQAMIEHPITRTVKVQDPVTGEAREEVKVLHHGLTRKVINKHAGRIKRMFAWAVEEGLVPPSVHQALACVAGLKKGKSVAREKPRVKPAPDAWVEGVLPLVPPTVRTMIDVQRLSGCRPQDIVQLRAIDIDMTGPVWEYRPPRYKTEHRNEEDSPDRERVVFLGPRAQALLKPYLTLNVTDYLFSPRRSEEARNAKRREGRKTPKWASHMKRTPKGRTRAPIRARYDVTTYRRAIARACLKAGVPVWRPNQLRHARGTEVRKRYGLEASQAVLGHAELGVTQVYAEADRDTAKRIMAEIG
jgi:integrase